jgi:DNA repair exonuclease SbcCD ATPase subunit
MNNERPLSLLEHFTRQFAAQAARGGDCAGPLADVASAGQEVRRLQHELEHAEARAARADERVRQAEQRVEDADAEITHWEELAARDAAEEQWMRSGALETEFWIEEATQHLGEAEAAYQVCRSGPGGHERGACAGQSAQVKHWHSVIAGYKDAIDDLRRQERALQRRRSQEEKAAEAAKQARATAEEKAKQAEAERDDLTQEVAAVERELLAAKEALAQAHAALRKCRKNHPAEDCGDRGGPGVRLYGRGAEKKCASWKDVLGTAQ